MLKVSIVKDLMFFTSPIDKRLLGGAGIAGFLGLKELKPVSYYLLTWSASSLAIYWGGKAADKMGLLFPLWYRFIFFGMLPLHILLGIIVFDWVSSLETRKARALTVASILVLAATFGVCGTMVLAHREPFISPEIREVYGLIPEGSIVIAGKTTTEILAGYFGVTMVRPVLHEERDRERLASMERFSDPEVTGKSLRG